MNPFKLTVLATLVAAVAGVGLTSAQAPEEGAVRRQAARVLGLAESSVLIDTIGTRRVDGIGLVTLTKVTEKESGITTALAFNGQGDLVDLAASSTTSVVEKISPLLADRLDAAPGATLKIGVWFRFDEQAADCRAEMANLFAAGVPVDDVRAEMRRRVKTANSAVIEAASALLRTMGLEVGYADEFAPVVFTEANAALITELAASPLVDAIYPSLTYESELDSQVPTHRWDRVHDFGVRGKGVKVAIVENDGVLNTHPAINHQGFYNAGSPNVGSHPTAVAGILGSGDSSYPGHARNVEIYSGNANSWNDPDLMGAATWAIGQGVDVINMSFGFDTGLVIALLDRYVDYQVRYTSTTIVKSAGNEGGGTNNCTSPGLGWNVLTVGNFMDSGDADWVNDAINPGSSFDDPISTHGDRQKPDLAAVGTSITTCNVAGGFSGQGSGTSYAAPAIVGMAACFMQMSGSFSLYPELVRAVLMAGASHNLEGSSRLSDKDGAGGVNGLNAYRIVQENQWTAGTFTPASFSSSGYYTRNIALRGGDRCRIVLCWSSRVTAGYAADVLDADLDISIFQGANQTSGSVLASSSSYDNSFEIVEFVAPATDTYTIRVNDFRFDGASEEFAMAWTQTEDARYVRFRESLPASTANDFIGPTIGNPAFGLFPYDPHNPNELIYAWASAGDNIGYALSDGRLIYGDLDALTYYSLTPGNGNFTNFGGYYGPNGSYEDYHVAIPDLAAYIGYPIYFTTATYQGGSPNGVKELSRTQEVKLHGHAVNRTLSDNGSVFVSLGFSFPFFGSSYTQCWINANGNVTFGASSSDSTESTTDLLNGPPRIAAFWDDLDPAQGGLVRTRSGGDHFIIEWVAVPQHNVISDQNGVMLVLHSNGKIEMKYRYSTLDECIVGVSPGGGAAGVSVDITDGYQVGNYDEALYESFLGNLGFIVDNFDLSAPLSFFGSYVERTNVTFTRMTSLFSGVRYRVEIDN